MLRNERGKGRGTMGSEREMEDRLLYSPYSLAKKPWQIPVLLLVLTLLPCSGTHWAALTNEPPTSGLWVGMVVNRLWALELSTLRRHSPGDTCHSYFFCNLNGMEWSPASSLSPGKLGFLLPPGLSLALGEGSSSFGPSFLIQPSHFTSFFFNPWVGSILPLDPSSLSLLQFSVHMSVPPSRIWGFPRFPPGTYVLLWECL